MASATKPMEEGDVGANFTKGGKLVWLEGEVTDEEEFYFANRKQIKNMTNTSPVSFCGYGQFHGNGNKIWLGAMCHSSKSDELSAKAAFSGIIDKVDNAKIAEYEVLLERFNTGDLTHVLTQCREDKFFFCEHGVTDEEKWTNFGMQMDVLGLTHGVRWWAMLKNKTEAGKYACMFRCPPDKQQKWACRYWQIWNELPNAGIDLTGLTMKITTPKWEGFSTEHLPESVQAILEKTNGMMPVNINRNTLQYSSGDYISITTQTITDYERWFDKLRAPAVIDGHMYAGAHCFWVGLAQRDELRAKCTTSTATRFSTLESAMNYKEAGMSPENSMVRSFAGCVDLRNFDEVIFKVLKERLVSPFHVLLAPSNDTVVWMCRHNVKDVEGFMEWIDQADMLGKGQTWQYHWSVVQNVDDPTEVSMIMTFDKAKMDEVSVGFFDMVSSPEFTKLVKTETFRVLMFDTLYQKQYKHSKRAFANWGPLAGAIKAFVEGGDGKAKPTETN